MSLRWRLTIGVALIEITLLTILVLVMIGIVRDASLDGIKHESESSTDLLAAAATVAVLTNDLATLEALIDKVEQQPNVLFAQVTDANGALLAGASESLLNSANSDTTLTASADVFHNNLDLGQISIVYDLSAQSAIVAKAYRWGISIGVAELVLVAVSALLLCAVLTRELQALCQRSLSLAEGSIETPITTRGRLPEVKTIANTLETMRIKLRQQLINLRVSNDALLHESEQKEIALRAEREQAQHNAHVFAVLGHEIRTPVSLAVMMLQDPDSRLNTASVLENLTHALELVDDLNIKSNGQASSIKYQTTELSDFLQELSIGLSPIFRDTKIKFSAPQLEGIDRRVELPTQALRQIVRNLTKNAAIHSEATQVDLSLTVTDKAADSCELQFTLRDNGKGIAEKDRARVFEPFTKLRSESPGSGLGLSVCRDLATAMEADLVLESGDQGTTFILTLPVKVENRAQAAVKESETPKPVQQNLLEGKRVLVAEDNLTIQLLTQKILSTAGALVTVAKDGAEALEKFAEHFDLVLTDIHMPNMDGIELTRELRRLGHAVPIVGVTAATIGEESRALLGAGANDCLGKPFNLRELNKRLDGLFV